MGGWEVRWNLFDLVGKLGVDDEEAFLGPRRRALTRRRHRLTSPLPVRKPQPTALEAGTQRGPVKAAGGWGKGAFTGEHLLFGARTKGDAE